MLDSDTTPEMQKRYDRLWKQLPPEKRFLKGLQFVRVCHQMFLAGFRTRFPDLNTEDFCKKIITTVYKISV